MRKIILFLTVTFFLLSACSQNSQASPDSASRAATDTLLPAPDVTASADALYRQDVAPVASATLTSLPSASPTQTPIPETVFDPAQAGDLSKFDSYVVSYHYEILKGTGASGIEEQTTGDGTRTVIVKPWQVKIINHWTDYTAQDQSTADSSQTQYWIGDKIYGYDEQAEFWLIRPEAGNEKYIGDPLASVLSRIKSARFTGQEECQGIPANHYIFDQNDLAPAPGMENYKVEETGNIWTAQDGNYLLHLDIKAVGLWPERSEDGSLSETYSPGSRTEAFDVSSINKVQEIDLPPDLPTQVELDIGLPIPPGVKLESVMVPKESPPSYDYSSTLTDDEILAFYASLQPTNGWEVKMTAKDPDGQGGIVRLTKDGHDVMFVIYYYDYGQEYRFSFSYPT